MLQLIYHYKLSNHECSSLFYHRKLSNHECSSLFYHRKLSNHECSNLFYHRKFSNHECSSLFCNAKRFNPQSFCLFCLSDILIPGHNGQTLQRDRSRRPLPTEAQQVLLGGPDRPRRPRPVGGQVSPRPLHRKLLRPRRGMVRGPRLSRRRHGTSPHRKVRGRWIFWRGNPPNATRPKVAPRQSA